MPHQPSPLSDRSKLEEAIKASSSKTEVLIHLGLRAAGGNFRQLDKWAEHHGLVVPLGDRNSQTLSAQIANTRPDSEVFCENSSYVKRDGIKRRLRRVWTNWVCKGCGIGEEWNGRPLVLQLEHINGVWNDNRIENLCLLCPNCHSQTETFAGKSKSRNTPVVQ